LITTTPIRTRTTTRTTLVAPVDPFMGLKSGNAVKVDLNKKQFGTSRTLNPPQKAKSFKHHLTVYNVRNPARFNTTFDFDREYLRNYSRYPKSERNVIVSDSSRVPEQKSGELWSTNK